LVTALVDSLLFPAKEQAIQCILMDCVQEEVPFIVHAWGGLYHTMAMQVRDAFCQCALHEKALRCGWQVQQGPCKRLAHTATSSSHGHPNINISKAAWQPQLIEKLL
jgi:hypothetical protein